MSRVLYRIGHFAGRHPWRVLAAWVLIAVTSVMLNSSFGGAPDESFSIPGAESQRAADAIEPRFRPCVEGIRQETDTLGRVVTNFLNFARPEQVALAPVDLESIARGAAADLEGELPPGSTLLLSGSYGRIDGDEVMLR